MKSSQFDLLKTRRFLPLFITQFLGAFNDNTFKNALVILITYRIAQAAGLNAQLLVTLAAGIFILPFFLFSATAGQLADKFEKSRLIAAVKFFEIPLMLLATTGFFLQSVPILMTTLFFLGTQATFFGPVKYAILPDALREDELIAGNGLIEAGTFLSILLGTILGGVLVLMPKGEIIISMIVCLLAVTGFISSLYVPNTNIRNPNLKISFNFIAETYRILQYSQERWDIYLSILGISWFWLIGAVFLAEVPVFTRDILHANENVVTWLIALFSIGIAIGSLLCNKLLKGKVHATYVPLGALGMTIFTIDLYFAANFASMMQHAQQLNPIQFLGNLNGWRVSLDLTLISVCGGLYTVPLYAMLQTRSDEAHRARVIASNNVMNALFMVIAAALTIVMLNLGMSVNQVFLAVALVNGVVALFICRLLPDVLVRSALHWLFQTFYKVKVVGMENYVKAGTRVVIVSNHSSFLDAALLAVYLPDKLTFAIDTYTAKSWWIRLFLMLVDAYPVDPSNSMAIKSLIEFVRQDKRCIIFPEGRLTVTGALMKIYEGPGLVADKSGAKLLPIRIQGAQYTPFSRLRGKVRIRWMPQITITIFPAETMEIPDELKGRSRRHQISLKLYDLMTRVMFESSNYRQTLFTSLIDAVSIHGRKLPIVEDIQRIPVTYQQFITRCFILGDRISRKTSPGEYVGVLLPNTASNAITFFALQAYCRVPAMLNYSTGAKNVLLACQTAQIRIVYSSRTFVEMAKLEEMVAVLQKEGIRVIFLEDLRNKINFMHKWNGVLMAQFPRFSYRFINYSRVAHEMMNPDTPAVVLFTSGSEGTPKGVVLTHKNLQANRCQLEACIDFSSNDKVLNALPVFHSFGLTGGMMLPILSGVPVFFYPSPLHYRIVPQVSYDMNATIIFGTDTFLTGYAKYAHPYDFYSIRYVFAGAEKLRQETLLTWAYKFGVRIFEGYGATEASPVIATNTPMQNKIGTVGRLLPGIKGRLKPVPGIDEGGVLEISGPNIMKGYLLADNPGQLVPPQDGWYDTGDIVSIDESGYVTIKGRVKRFAKIGGEMISLVMVETQINKLWPEFQHAVVNIPDPKKGEQLVLVTTNPKATREEVVAFARANLMGEITTPKKILIVKEMPLLGSGKVNYPDVKELVLNAFANEPVEEDEDELE